jgi:hypothetical protein
MWNQKQKYNYGDNTTITDPFFFGSTFSKGGKGGKGGFSSK